MFLRKTGLKVQPMIYDADFKKLQKYSREFFSISFIAVALLLFIATFAVTNTPAQESEIGFEEKLGEYVPLDLTFTNEEGSAIQLKQLLDKPTILTLVYYNCPGICSPLLSGVVEVLNRMDLQPGKDYRVLTISFNPRETAQLAKEKKRNYFHAFTVPFPEDQWTWMTGDSVNIARLTDAVGFRYKKSGDGFVHPAAIMVLSGKGKISRYLNGITFLPFDLKMAIIEASQGKVGPTIAKVLRLCFNYDPQANRYVFNFLRVSGALVLLFALIFITIILVKGKVQKSKTR